MKLSELAAYAEKKYHIREERKWDNFRGFSVLADPDTGKWAALMMQQWDYETGTELCRCDIKCGRQILKDIDAPYVTGAFRMKGEKWVGVIFDDRTEPETVFRLFDEAVRIGRAGGCTIVLERPQKEESAQKEGKVYRDTLLPLESMRGNYDKTLFHTGGNAKKDAGEEKARPAAVQVPHTAAGQTTKPAAVQVTRPMAGQTQIPKRILEMMQLYEYGTTSFENRCRNFIKQGRFMEDYEDDAPWNCEFRRYFTTYHDLNLNQLRGYFAWRARVRRGEFHPISTSLAYMYIYELLNLIGASDPAQALERMKEFETGYLDSGIGDRSMRENLHRWMMEFAVLSGASLQEVIPFLDSSLLERDRNLLMLRNPLEHTDEEVFGALNALTEGKTERSSALIKEPERARHLFAQVWREMSEHYEDDGWDLFTCCFGKLRKFPWHPLANAIYLDQKDREDTEYKITECRMFVCKKNEWSEIRYDELFFDKYRIHAVMHEADRLIRRYLGTGHYLRQKQGEEWITPYVEAVIEADKAAALEAAKPKVRIDLSGLDKIRRDAQITRDSLLTQEEIREQAPIPGELPAVNDRPAAVRIEQPQEIVPEISQEKEKSAIIKIPSLDETLVRVLESAMRGEPAAELIRENHLMPSVVTDAINEALFDEIGDNVLECEGDEITLVDDYREDLERLLEGEN